MNKCVIFIVVFFIVSSISVHAQESAIADAINKNVNSSLINKEKTDRSSKIKLWEGWSAGLNFGLTKFKGDISQYDYYPAYQEVGDFFELRTAMSFNFEKKINTFYSLAIELSTGKFAGLRRENSYSGYTVFDPWSDNYEGRGDKFLASFSEIDLLVNMNLTNAMSYFSKSKRARKIYFKGRLGLGYNVFHTSRRNLFSDTYINSFGYSDEGLNMNSADIDYGNQKKSFFTQATTIVYVYGIRANYRLNPKIELNIDYTIRNGMTDKWDASIINTQYTTDRFAFLSIGAVYKIGDHDYNDDWASPIDILKDNVSTLDIRIEGFTDDSDNDGVADAFDKGPNTPLGVAVDGAGKELDIDMDNVPDYRDTDPFSNRGALVDANGIEFDDDKDGVPNSKDLESNTSLGAIVNQFGMNVTKSSSFSAKELVYFPSIYFNSGSAIVGNSNKNRIATIALLLRNNQHIRLHVIGHADNVGNASFNKELGLKRAHAVINYLASNYNIDTNRLFAKTKGEEEPLLTVTNSENGGLNPLSEINRRVDFEIRK